MRLPRLFVTMFAFAAFAAGQSACFNPEYASPGYACNEAAGQTCPDSQVCIAGHCVGGSGGGGFDMGLGIVPKSGMYTGQHIDPGLNIDSAKCTDSPLEPNNDIAHAVPGLTQQLNLVPDQPSQALGNDMNPLVICPQGTKDLDYYQIDAAQSLSAVVQITYDVKYGDLDVGIFRADGTLVAGDGTAVSNGCVAATLPAGSYFVGVGGANNTDVNRYTMRIRYYSQPKTCAGTSTPVDMGF